MSGGIACSCSPFRYRTSCLEAIICSLSLAFPACYKRRRSAREATAMALFYTDSLAMCYSNLESAKHWWIEVFDCKQVGLPDWDDPLPSDIALSKLAGEDEPTILLCDRREVQ